MTHPDGNAILAHLREVQALRDRQAREAMFGLRVRQIKAFQHQRFARTYDDLLKQGRFAKASRFFLEELYGPHDFSERDAQFARIVPALVRLFPAEIVRTVHMLAHLHALSERFDAEMAVLLPPEGIEVGSYRSAWRQVGDPEGREQQISLMLDIGRSLQKYTRNPVLRTSLKLMRGPAHAAGLGALQEFLENGFDTFRDLGGHAGEFLETVAHREREVVSWLFSDTDHTERPVGF